MNTDIIYNFYADMQKCKNKPILLGFIGCANNFILLDKNKLKETNFDIASIVVDISNVYWDLDHISELTFSSGMYINYLINKNMQVQALCDFNVKSYKELCEAIELHNENVLKLFKEVKQI